MTETFDRFIFDDQLCRDSEDLLILASLEQEEEARLSEPITGNVNCLNLILTVTAMVIYGIVSILL